MYTDLSQPALDSRTADMIGKSRPPLGPLAATELDVLRMVS
jgi:hypothetical protein